MAVLFTSPIAIVEFGRSFASVAAPWLDSLALLTPFGAAFSLPLDHKVLGDHVRAGNWNIWFAFVGFDVMLIAALAGAMLWLFKVRWRVAS